MKNYTSGVTVERTIGRIEAVLARAGACDILKEYEAGTVSAVSFTVKNPMDSGKRIAIRLPANVRGVEDALKKQVIRPQAGTLKRIREQAPRTAWKISMSR